MTTVGDLRATRSGVRQLVIDATGRAFARRVRRLWALDRHEVENFQLRRLHEVYRVATTATPYYRNRPDLYPVDLQRGSLVDCVAALPLLSKQEVKANNQEFWSENPHWTTRTHTTSGTSGTPLHLRASLPEKAFARAVYLEWLRSIGAPLHGRKVAMSGFMTPGPGADSILWRDLASRRLFLSIYSLGDDRIEEAIQAVRDFRPQIVSGYSSAVTELARRWNERQEQPLLMHAITTSEVLLPQWRDEILRAFGSSFDVYGSQEGSHLVTQCVEGGRHVNPFIGLVEVLDDDGSPTPPGAIGRVIVTGLNRTSMPLLRYELGDAAEAEDPERVCACGLWWPLLGRVEGRSEDLVVTTDGRRIGMLGYSVLKDLPNVRQAQIVQHVDRSFTVRLVTESGREDPVVEELVRSKLLERVGREARVEFSYLAQIERGAAGKTKAVVVERDR